MGSTGPNAESSPNYMLYSSSAREILSDLKELRALILSKRKDYILETNSFPHDQQTSFQTQFDREIDVAVKQNDMLIKQFEEQINKDKTLRADDELKHLRFVGCFLTQQLRDVCTIIAQLRQVYLQRRQKIRRLCRLANLVEMWETFPAVRDKAEGKKAGHFRRVVAHSQENDKENEVIAQMAPKLSKYEQEQLQAENHVLYARLSHDNRELDTLETNLVEIQRLQHVFAEKVMEQEHDIDSIHTHTIHTLDNLDAANRFIQQAISNQADRRVVVLFILLTLTFTLLFLDWYNP